MGLLGALPCPRLMRLGGGGVARVPSPVTDGSQRVRSQSRNGARFRPRRRTGRNGSALRAATGPGSVPGDGRVATGPLAEPQRRPVPSPATDGSQRVRSQSRNSPRFRPNPRTGRHRSARRAATAPGSVPSDGRVATGPLRETHLSNNPMSERLQSASSTDREPTRRSGCHRRQPT